MADQLWTKTTSGNVFDDTGSTVVGSGDGAGTITIDPATVVAFGQTSTATLTITEGVTVKFGSGSKLRARGGLSFQGKIIIEGTAAEPVILTSDQGTPSAGDWLGVDVLGGATDPTKRPELEMEYCTIEYPQSCIFDSQIGTDFESRVRADHCIFQHFSVTGITRHGQGGYADANGLPHLASGPWEFSWCQFIQEPGDFGSTNQTVIGASGPGGGSVATRGTVWVTHCSVLVSMNDALDCRMLDCRTFSAINVKDSCFRGFNAGAGQMDYVYTAGGGIALGNNPGSNFISCDNLDAPGSSISYSLGLGEQIADPLYQDETTPPFDLVPTATAGDPDLAFAASDGIYVGALEPLYSSYPVGSLIPDPSGTVGVWAGRKQIVRRCSLGEDERRGRAIRIRLRSSDLKGEKLIGAVFLVASAEEMR